MIAIFKIIMRLSIVSSIHLHRFLNCPLFCCRHLFLEDLVHVQTGPSLRGGGRRGRDTPPPYKNALSANKLSVGKMLSVGRFLLVFVQSTDAIT